MKMTSQIRVDRSSLRKRHDALSAAGFTLIELMIVITIILILVGMALPRYDKAVRRAREAVLKYDLKTMREVIDQYTMDKEAAPESVEDLYHAGYLRAIPVDPVTQTREWSPKYDNVFLVPEQASTGIVDVYSKSMGTALDGTKYSDW